MDRASKLPAWFTYDQVEPEDVEFLMPGFVVRGKVNLLDGKPDQGKTFLVVDIAARFTRGAPMPGQEKGREPGNVLLLSAEDGKRDTLAPRLNAAGADMARVNGFDEWHPTFPSMATRFFEFVDERGIGLVLIDPIAAYLDRDCNANSDQDIRRVFTPLAKGAEARGLTFILIRHLNKKQGLSAINRGGGSIGIVGAARSAMLLGQDPQDPQRRILASVKMNLQRRPKAWALELDGDPIPRVKWLERVDMTADDLVRDSGESRSSKKAQAKELILAALAERNPIASNELKAVVTEAGISVRTYENARSELDLRIEKVGKGGWWVHLDTKGDGE